MKGLGKVVYVCNGVRKNLGSLRTQNKVGSWMDLLKKLGEVSL